MKLKAILVALLSLTLIQCTKEPASRPDGQEEQENQKPQEEMPEDPNFSDIVLEDCSNVLRKKISFSTTEKTDCHIEFWKEEDRSDLTRSKTSKDSRQHEIILLFMKDHSTYNWQIVRKDGTRSKTFHFETRDADSKIKHYILHGEVEAEEGFGFGGYILYMDKAGDMLVMVDDKGELVWYEQFAPKISTAFSFDPRTQTISFLHGTSPTKHCGSDITCIDLYGNRILDANETEVPYKDMHHDVCRMKDGNWIYTHFIKKDYDFSSLGVNETKTVTGDGLCVINSKREIVWEWKCFDHMNPLEDPNILKIDKRPVVEDWMHTNSIFEDKEGNLYLSCNKMKQIVKIKRQTGEVIFRLGFNGNVTIEGEIENELSPERLHSLQVLDDGEILLFENGDRDRGFSRFRSYKVNEAEKTAKLLTDITLPDGMASGVNSNVYLFRDNLYLVHSTEGARTIIIDKTGKIYWSKPLSGLSFRGIHVVPDLDRTAPKD